MYFVLKQEKDNKSVSINFVVAMLDFLSLPLTSNNCGHVHQSPVTNSATHFVIFSTLCSLELSTTNNLKLNNQNEYLYQIYTRKKNYEQIMTEFIFVFEPSGRDGGNLSVKFVM